MLEKKLNEMNPLEIQIADNIIQRTLDRLLVMYGGVSERGIKALFLINGGGIVAMLAFLHDSYTNKNIYLLLSLGCFLLGLILTVMLVGIDYYIGMRFLNNYTSNINKLNNGEIKLRETQNYTTPCRDCYLYPT